MPRQIVPPAARRPLGGLLLALLAAVAAYTYIVKYRETASGSTVCHPNLARLRANDGREILLIGTLCVDLDEESARLVTNALNAQHPEVVMLEGSPPAVSQAMISTGHWEILGIRRPNDTEWMNLDPELHPVELQRPRQKRGFLQLFSGSVAPERSLVPLKVNFWAYHLLSSVGGNLCATVAAASRLNVPLRFLGPPEGGMQGYVQVSAIANQAAGELLEEERKKGQLSSEDMNVALQRAEKHVREVFDKWAHDGRAECNRLLETLKKEGPEIYSQQEERASRLAESVLRTMEDYRRGAVVLTTIEQYVTVQKELEQAGFVFVSQCATKSSA
mmetsp:Transcript_148955/g.211598  ORF Transcript_148955/g.211598 Transcript_148955/m.211598 type:complete len:332 (-) Transcript_148955:60-1055(-)